MFHRAVTGNASLAFQQAPVLCLEGAREAGKSTLAAQLAGEGASTHTLDDASVRALGVDDPHALFAPSPTPVVLKELQRAPAILEAIADRVAKDKAPGQIILTSSVRMSRLAVPKKLRKRMRVVTVHTPSRSELLGQGGDWLSLILRRRRPSPTPIERDELAHLLASRSDTGPSGLRQHLRGDWIEASLAQIFDVDAPSVGSTQPQLLRDLLQALAEAPATELNTSQLSRRTGASRGTVDKHIAILDALFLITTLQGWPEGITSRPVQRPKLHLADTRLSAALSGQSPEALADPSGHLLLGRLMEQLTVNELTKQAAVSPVEQRLWHFRDRNGLQVPLVIETPEGIVAIDVHAARSVAPAQVRPLAQFRDRAAGAFRAGVILHMGKAATLGDRLHALPINSLWEHSPAR